jgi:hypothetical protein
MMAMQELVVPRSMPRILAIGKFGVLFRSLAERTKATAAPLRLYFDKVLLM